VAAPDAVVYLVEGEKDADRLASLGLVATCNAGGAGKWRKEHSEFLRGRHVVVLPDNDDAGREHARKAVKALRGIATDVRVVELPDLPEKGDVSDWLDAGGSVAALEDMLKEAPAANAEPGEDEPEKKPSQTDLLVKFVRERFDLLHDKNGDTYASDRHTGEVRRMGARQFRDRVTAVSSHKWKLQCVTSPGAKPWARCRPLPGLRATRRMFTSALQAAMGATGLTCAMQAIAMLWS